GVTLSLLYDTSLFDDAQIETIGSYYSTVLAALAARPSEHHATVCLLSEAERRQLLIDWNDTQTEYPQDRCVHQLFETQAAHTPDAVALQMMNDEDRATNGPDPSLIVHRSSFIVQVTYAELNARANQLAHYLRSLGVGPEMRVGLWLERSLDMVVA